MFKELSEFIAAVEKERRRVEFEYGIKPSCMFISVNLLEWANTHLEHLPYKIAPHSDTKTTRYQINGMDVFRVVEPDVIRTGFGAP